MLQNARLLVKIGFDTAENEPSKIWQMLINFRDGLDFPQGRLRELCFDTRFYPEGATRTKMFYEI